MAIKDEIREEQKKFKDMPLKGKIGYIRDYYKFHILIGILVIIFGAVFLRDYIVNSRPDYLNAVMLNTILDYAADSDITGDLAAYAGVDREEYKITIDTTMRIDLEHNDQMSMASEQKILALFSADEIDVMAAPLAIMDTYAPENAFSDIHAIMDDAQIKAMEEAGFPVYYATCDGQTFPAGFYIRDSVYLRDLSEHGTFVPEEEPVFAVTSRLKHPDAALQLLKMISGQ
ncbi:MAG: hypothetical protein J5518_00280 [Lachnospiraceae bacterium]|nr:hypothetical protein [Lachnospiraceae bacterium]